MSDTSRQDGKGGTSVRRVHLLGANVREGATRRAEEPVTPQGPGLSSGTRKGEGGRVRNLAYLALSENRPVFKQELNM